MGSAVAPGGGGVGGSGDGAPDLPARMRALLGISPALPAGSGGPSTALPPSALESAASGKLGPIVCADVMVEARECGLLREACLVYKSLGERRALKWLPPHGYQAVFEAALLLNDVPLAKTVSRDFRTVVIAYRHAAVQEREALLGRLLAMHEGLAEHLLTCGLDAGAMQVLGTALADELLAGCPLSSTMQARLSSMVLDGTLTPDMHPAVYDVGCASLTLNDKLARLRKSGDWAGIVKLWTSGAIKPELLADKYWLPVLSALHKANLLPEVFPLAPRLGKLVLLESDAEIVLHHLIGVAATAEHIRFVGTLCCNRLAKAGTVTSALFARLAESGFARGSFELAVELLTKTADAAIVCHTRTDQRLAYGILVRKALDCNRMDVVKRLYRQAGTSRATRAYTHSSAVCNAMLKLAIEDKEARIADAVYRDACFSNFSVEPALLESLFTLLLDEKLVDMACDLIVTQSHTKHPLSSQCFIAALERLAALQHVPHMSRASSPRGPESTSSSVLFEHQSVSTRLLQVYGEATLTGASVSVSLVSAIIRQMVAQGRPWSLHRVLATIPCPSTLDASAIFAVPRMPYSAALQNLDTGITHARNVAALEAARRAVVPVSIPAPSSPSSSPSSLASPSQARRKWGGAEETMVEKPGRMTSFGDVVLFFSDAEIVQFASAITTPMVHDIFRACDRDSFFRPATLFLWRHFLRLGVSVPPVAVVSVVEAALAMDLRAAGVADALKLALAAVETLPAASRSARFYTSVVRAHVALGSASNALAASEEATKAEIVLPKEVQDAVTKLGVSSAAVSSGPLLDKASK